MLLVVSPNTLREAAKSIEFMAAKFEIIETNSIKILGYFLNYNLDYQNYINSIISKVNHRMYTIDNRLYRLIQIACYKGLNI